MNTMFDIVGNGTNPVAEMVVGAATPHKTAQVTGQVTAQVTGQVIEQVLLFCRTPRKAIEIRELLGLKHRETFTENYLRPLIEAGLLELTIPDKPRSRLQKYRLTNKGRSLSTKQTQEAGTDEE